MANQPALFLAAALIISACPLTATATMELYLSDGSGDAHQVEIAPGESFVIEVGLATNEPTFGLNYNLNISENGSGAFTIIDRVIPVGSPFTDLITSNADLLVPSEALLDPYNNRDLGALVQSATVPQPAGINALARVTISPASGLAPGTYTLSALGAFGVTADLQMEAIITHDYTIVVTDGSSDDTDGNDSDDADPTDVDGGSGDTTDDGTADADTGGQTDDGSSDGEDTGIVPLVVSTSRCGAGFGATAVVGVLLAMRMIRPTARRG